MSLRPKITYRRVLAIDPAVRRTGWAVLDANGRRVTRVVKTGVYRSATSQEIHEFAKAMSRPAVRPDIVALESQYFDKNIATLISLVEVRTKFQVCFELRGIPVVLVPANDWQIGLLLGLITRKSRREERKAAAMSYVKQLHCPDVKTQDEADAIAIGVWAVRADLISPACATAAGG